VFIASNIIVSETVYFANLLNISVFYISLLVVALGTDLPEISLLIRSLMSGKRELAMGDFFGAAAASTLLFGIFTILSGGEVLVINNFWVTFVFIILAIVLLYVFSRSKNFITRKEGLVMLGVYILFIFVEMWQR
ncbi:hypothetical protein HY357_01750, partial [Candidatus Roizmanbacteria bacterium]|nr:hypothetical protein [Candidatus Roizmanbacteria bacterium]